MRVRAVQCSNCGGRARLDDGAKEAACLHCGQPVKLSQALLQEQESARKFPPQTPLKLGMKARLDGKEFEATGRQVMVQTAEGETYTWEEWVLIADDGDLRYLEYDDGKWKISTVFTPDTPPSPAFLSSLHNGSPLHLNDFTALVTDSGISQLAHAEGEFPYLVTPGRHKQFVDATTGVRFYSVEYDQDSVECYQGQLLDERQVYSWFDLRDLIKRLDSRTVVLQSRRRFGALCLVGGLVCLVLWAMALGSGKPVSGATGSATLTEAVGEGKRFGPVNLSRAGVHRLEVDGRMTGESNWVQVIMEDEAESELFTAARDMWDESGYDSDGAWHESDLHASSDFVVKKPGKYYLRLVAEAEPGRMPSSGSSASFRLKEGAVYPIWMGLAGFLGLLVGFGFLVGGSPTGVQKFKQSMANADDD